MFSVHARSCLTKCCSNGELAGRFFASTTWTNAEGRKGLEDAPVPRDQAIMHVELIREADAQVSMDT